MMTRKATENKTPPKRNKKIARTTRLGRRLLRSLDQSLASAKAGRLDKLTARSMRLGLTEASYSPAAVRRIRGTLGLSQMIFAEFLGVSLNTVQAWEQGVNPPQPIAARFMDEIRRNPGYWKKRLADLRIEA
jgi:putative transcriptional regulator